MKYSLAVMAHESREQHFPYLKEKLGDVPFFIDKGKIGEEGNLGIWGNCRRAWLAYNPEAEWHFVIQDDAIICNNFHERLTERLEKIGKGDYLLSLYAGERAGKYIEGAKRNGRDYVAIHIAFNEVAFGLRTKHIDKMVAYLDGRGVTVDKYIQTFARRNQLKTYYPLPSLIDHRAGTSLYRSMTEKHNAETARHAYWFIDNNL